MKRLAPRSTGFSFRNRLGLLANVRDQSCEQRGEASQRRSQNQRYQKVL